MTIPFISNRQKSLVFPSNRGSKDKETLKKIWITSLHVTGNEREARLIPETLPVLFSQPTQSKEIKHFKDYLYCCQVFVAIQILSLTVADSFWCFSHMSKMSFSTKLKEAETAPYETKWISVYKAEQKDHYPVKFRKKLSVNWLRTLFCFNLCCYTAVVANHKYFCHF